LTKFVLDSSVTLSWVFKDEAAPETDALELQARDYGAVIPSLWYVEIGNALLMAEKQKRITREDAKFHIKVITSLPLEPDRENLHYIMEKTLSLARAHDLTTYDAAYLELALRHDIPLATKNKDLRVAAGKLGVAVLPE
jgi:predicted nucleic acid-binding protein